MLDCNISVRFLFGLFFHERTDICFPTFSIKIPVPQQIETAAIIFLINLVFLCKGYSKNHIGSGHDIKLKRNALLKKIKSQVVHRSRTHPPEVSSSLSGRGACHSFLLVIGNISIIVRDNNSFELNNRTSVSYPYVE